MRETEAVGGYDAEFRVTAVQVGGVDGTTGTVTPTPPPDAATRCKHGTDLARFSCGNCASEMTAPWRASRNPDRNAAKRFADAHGYFWLPCTRCGEWFGGMEWGVHRVPCALDGGRTGHGACCPKVSNEGDRDACRRAHEMHGDTPTAEQPRDAEERADEQG